MIGFRELSKREYLEAENYDLPPEALEAIEKEKLYQSKQSSNKPKHTAEELEELARLDKQMEYQQRFKR